MILPIVLKNFLDIGWISQNFHSPVNNSICRKPKTDKHIPWTRDSFFIPFQPSHVLFCYIVLEMLATQFIWSNPFNQVIITAIRWGASVWNLIRPQIIQYEFWYPIAQVYIHCLWVCSEDLNSHLRTKLA